MYCVYVARLQNKRLYSGQTKLWRIKTRWEEHMNPNVATTRWTTEYPVCEKLAVFKCSSLKECRRLENDVCEALMEAFGLDVCRGGNWNMLAEGPVSKWWVPPRLKHVPCFTEEWSTLCERTFAESARNVLTRFGALPQL